MLQRERDIAGRLYNSDGYLFIYFHKFHKFNIPCKNKNKNQKIK